MKMAALLVLLLLGACTAAPTPSVNVQWCDKPDSDYFVPCADLLPAYDI